MTFSVSFAMLLVATKVSHVVFPPRNVGHVAFLQRQADRFVLWHTGRRWSGVADGFAQQLARRMGVLAGVIRSGCGDDMWSGGVGDHSWTMSWRFGLWSLGFRGCSFGCVSGRDLGRVRFLGSWVVWSFGARWLMGRWLLRFCRGFDRGFCWCMRGLFFINWFSSRWVDRFVCLFWLMCCLFFELLAFCGAW